MKLYYMSTNGWNAILAIDGERACYYVDSYEDENIVGDDGKVIAYYPARDPEQRGWSAEEEEAAAKKYLRALAECCIFEDLAAGNMMPGTWDGTAEELDAEEWPGWENDVVAEYDTKEA